MNEIVVDLSNFREATDGDKELEQELFEEFYASSDDIMVKLDAHCTENNDNETWRQAAHALKGLAINLGAARLGELCKKGQDMSENSIPEKQELLHSIKSEHTKVIEYLKSQD